MNAEGIQSPRARTKYRYRGWVASTVREILQNKHYTGEWSFGKKRWVKVPGTKKRQYRHQPEDRIIRQSFPNRRIVDVELWDAVQERRAAVTAHFTGNGKKKGSFMGRKTPYLFSGIIHCAKCQAPMSITGGSNHRYYGCNDQKKRGKKHRGIQCAAPCRTSPRN